MVFVHSGFGKTNLVKVLLYHIVSDISFGKLIFDLNGEYFMKSKDTLGLGDIDEQKIKDNVVVYTDKDVSAQYKVRFVTGGKVLLNMRRHMSIGDILNFGTGFSSVMENFLHYLDDEGVEDFINKIDEYVNDPALLHKQFPDFFKKTDTSATCTVGAIRKRLRPLIDENKGLHSSSSTMLEDIFRHLKQGKTVIV